MQVDKRYEEKAEGSSLRALIEDVKKYSQELGLEINLSSHILLQKKWDSREVDRASLGRCYKEELRKRMEVAKSKNCQEKLVATRWNGNDLEDDRF